MIYSVFFIQNIKCKVEYKSLSNFNILFTYNKTSMYLFASKAELDQKKRISVNIFDRSYSKGRIPSTRNKQESQTSDIHIYRSTIIEKSLLGGIKNDNYNISISILIVDQYVGDNITKALIIASSIVMKMYLGESFELVLPFLYCIDNQEHLEVFGCCSKYGITYLDVYIKESLFLLYKYLNKNLMLIVDEISKDVQHIEEQINKDFGNLLYTYNDRNISNNRGINDTDLLYKIEQYIINNIDNGNSGIMLFNSLMYYIDDIYRRNEIVLTPNEIYKKFINVSRKIIRDYYPDRINNRKQFEVRPIDININQFNKSNANVIVSKNNSLVLVNAVLGNKSDILFENNDIENISKLQYVQYISPQYVYEKHGIRSYKKHEIYNNKIIENIINLITKQDIVIKFTCDVISEDSGSDILSIIGIFVCLFTVVNTNDLMYGIEYGIYKHGDNNSFILKDVDFFEVSASDSKLKIFSNKENNVCSLIYMTNSYNGTEYNNNERILDIISDYMANINNDIKRLINIIQ